MKFNKIAKKFAAAALAGVLMVSSMGMTASAANTSVTGDNTTYSLDKYLVMDQDANVPSVSFSYTVTSQNYQEATTTTPEIKKGIDTVTVATTSFDSTASTYSDVQSGDTLTLGSSEKYAVAEAAIDLRGATFAEPGIYGYVITEDEVTADGVTAETKTIYMYVYVETTSTGALTISNVILSTSQSDIPKTDGTLSTKTSGFVNNYSTSNITLTKTVTGNQGDLNEYFEFTVIINGAAGTVYDVQKGSYQGDPAKIEISSGTTSVTATYHLKSGETLTIKGLTDNTTYTITEKDYSTEGYTTTNSASTTNGKTTGSLTVGNVQTVTFTNSKNVTTPTGIALSIAPYVLMVAFAGVVAVLFLRKRKYEI